MAAIFPPADKGGIPPGVNVVNGYTPVNHVVGEGPLYVSSDCTTVLTSDQMNAFTSEILAAVDKLGFPYNSTHVTNLADLLVVVLNAKVDVSGDTMTGPLNVVHPPTAPANAVSKQYVDESIAAEVAIADEKYVDTAGDVMTGFLFLNADPVQPPQAATKKYVDDQITIISEILGMTIVSSDEPPAMPHDNTLWFETDTGLFYIHYNDGNTKQWVVIPPSTSAASINAVTYVPQQLTTQEQAQARQNIAASDNNTVSYAQQILTLPQQTQSRMNIYAAPLDALAYSGMQINGSIDISQEKGSLATPSNTGANTYVCDGWFMSSTSVAGVLSGSVVPQVPGTIPGFSNAAVIATAIAQPTLAAADILAFAQPIEGYRWARLGFGVASAKPVVIGFWSGHHRPGIYSVALRNGAGDRSFVTTYTQAIGDVWQYNTVTIPACLDGTWEVGNLRSVTLSFAIGSGANFIAPVTGQWAVGNYLAAAGQVNAAQSTADVFRITGVVVLPGNEVPEAERSSLIMRPYDQEIISCRRYLRRVAPSGAGKAKDAASAVFTAEHEGMRATPTVVATNTIAISDTINSFIQVSAGASVIDNAPDWGSYLLTSFIGLTPGSTYLFQRASDAQSSGRLQLSARL